MYKFAYLLICFGEAACLYCIVASKWYPLSVYQKRHS